MLIAIHHHHGHESTMILILGRQQNIDMNQNEEQNLKQYMVKIPCQIR